MRAEPIRARTRAARAPPQTTKDAKGDEGQGLGDRCRAAGVRC